MVSLCVIALALGAGDLPSPPQQPENGPGGADYGHGSARVTVYGSGDDRYWLYEPADPTPASAPVLLYLHGYGSMTDQSYRPLLTHLARKGHTVIYPRYGQLWNPWAYEDNAVGALRNGLEKLRSPDHVAPETDRFAIAGHSLGGILSLRIADRAAESGLPEPRAVVLHDAAGFITPAYPWMPLDDLSQIPPECLLVVVMAETSIDDRNATGIVRRAWTETAQIPRGARNGLIIRSDDRGSPALDSDHLGVQDDPVDAVDWHGYWKFTEAALDAAFWGTHTEYVLGDGPEIRSLGRWSDDVPVREVVPASDLGY